LEIDVKSRKTNGIFFVNALQKENPRFSRVFFILRRFSALYAQSAAFLEIRILVKIKRCQSAFSSKGAEANLSLAFFTGIKLVSINSVKIFKTVETC
jgi:hypothetical protein